MKITAFNGSPRGKNSNTHVMVKEFLNGAKEAGAEVENIFLAEKNINHCRGCFRCWIETEGECVIDDDMGTLLEKMKSTDIIVLATPLYVDNVTGIMKDFLDRFVAVADPHFEKDAGGECRHLKKVKYPSKLVVISNCGFPEQSHFQVLRLLFRRVARNMHSEVVGEIYRAGGELLRILPPPLVPVISRYKVLLRNAGKEIVKNQRLSEETMKKLESPLIPDEQYIAMVNKGLDGILSKGENTDDLR